MTDDRNASIARIDTPPAWHSTALVALLLLVAATGSALSGRHRELVAVQGSLIVRAYLPLVLVSSGLLLYVCRVGRRHFAFVELAGLRG